MLAAQSRKPIEQDRGPDPRQRRVLRGRLEFESRKLTIDCAIRNCTENGALLVFGGALALPGEFELVVYGQNLRRKARLVWSTGLQAGVMFV